MTNAELADALNSDFALRGTDAVTINVIRQWVAWGALPPATAMASAIGRNPEWHRNDHAMRRASRLAELRKAGIRRKNAVIAQAFLEWGHVNIDCSRKAIINEYKKGRAQLVKSVTTDLEFANHKDLSAKRQQALKKQMGPLDHRFIGTQFEQSSELYAIALQLCRLGTSEAGQIETLLSGAFEKILPGFSALIDNRLTQIIIKSASGIFGDADEIGNSAQSVIENATAGQLLIARRITRNFVNTFSPSEELIQSVTLTGTGVGFDQLTKELRSLAPQIKSGIWLVFIYVAVLNAITAKVTISNRIGG